MKKAIVLICVFLFMGCGLSNVVNRGEYIDQKSIQPDTPRKELLARFGSPIDERVDEKGCRVEIFRCPQGETTSGKAIKGAGILILDVLTLGLTEAIFTPVTDGEKYVTFEVIYNEDESVKEFRFISR